MPCVSARTQPPGGMRITVLPWRRALATINGQMAETVLIVDDHAGFRASARALLEAEGFDVVGEAGDAAEAVEASRELHPDVVLLDIQLPDVDGVKASYQIHNGNGRPQIVLISSRDVSYLAGALAECPACGFICKSELSGEELRKLLA
jgi:DNA-binding NarL/FixJ family response regulator